MIFDRDNQRLTLEGIGYDRSAIEQLVKSADETLSPERRDLYNFLGRWFDASDTLVVHTSGSTGTPKQQLVYKSRMMESARLTCEFLNLREGETVLLCMNLRYIGAMMVVVRSLVCGLNLIVRSASGHPLTDLHCPIDFAAMVPLQVYNTLQMNEEKETLRSVKRLIIGGGVVDAQLEKKLSEFPYPIYSTYGMTETLSHIALRQINGSQASSHYIPFSSVSLSLSDEQTLVIDAPLVCSERLITNDMARLYPDGTFEILGRKDNIINSGGIKVQAEQVEERLRAHLHLPFAITSKPDEKLGEAVVLLVAGHPDVDALYRLIPSLLPPYHSPKWIISVDYIPLTETGKIDRAKCKKLTDEIGGQIFLFYKK